MLSFLFVFFVPYGQCATLTVKERGFDLAQVKDSSYPGVYLVLSFLELLLNLKPRQVPDVQLGKGCEVGGFGIVSFSHLGRYLMCD